MQATVVDLRYRMKEVLRALRRREKIKILYHGKVEGTIVPQSNATAEKITDHPFFGMRRSDKRSVNEIMHEIRGSRYDDF